MNDKISIIIPIYNINYDYFSTCINSILIQGYENFEILVIDDGSDNDMAKLYDQIALRDKRIKIFHQINQGVSAARNKGIELASGQYIMYMDADDVLGIHVIEKCLVAIKKTNADIAIFSSIKIKSYHEFEKYKNNKYDGYKIYEKDEFDIIRNHYLKAEKVLSCINENGYISRGPCTRIIKIDIVKQCLFDENVVIGEDILWNMKLLNICNKVCIVNIIGYGYLIHENSAIRKFYGNREKLASDYLIKLQNQNKVYCNTHKKEFAYNVAVEFYCWLNYDLMSKKCDLSNIEKEKIVRKEMEHYPWKVLSDENVRKTLPFIYKVMLLFCKAGLWQIAFKIKNRI